MVVNCPCSVERINTKRSILYNLFLKQIRDITFIEGL